MSKDLIYNILAISFLVFMVWFRFSNADLTETQMFLKLIGLYHE